MAVGVIGSVFSGFGIGANDVSNSMASVAGSKTLSLGTSLLLAAPAEFLGAVLLGRYISDDFQSRVTST